ncbi:CU044_2847 family protein [Micromonospora cathayae]|uniref:CU044_2847 family protein n=1 Tax=Micromonospora cathayae TaxID=3028804 RepID=A0ABY7ZWP4_9ACTN|nr:CU044_2847 family protein [Micromonospora sp. HUAS 3]WDZ87487.1 CU044_2847 family protein [Micromonospora sp. HUAS 3]
MAEQTQVQQTKVQLPTGQVIWATVYDEDYRAVSASRKMPRLDPAELRGLVQGVSTSIRQALDELAPDDVSIEFGVDFALKTTGLTSLLAEASSKASVKVTVSWRADGPLRATLRPGAPDPAEDDDGVDRNADGTAGQ